MRPVLSASVQHTVYVFDTIGGNWLRCWQKTIHNSVEKVIVNPDERSFSHISEQQEDLPLLWLIKNGFSLLNKPDTTKTRIFSAVQLHLVSVLHVALSAFVSTVVLCFPHWSSQLRGLMEECHDKRNGERTSGPTVSGCPWILRSGNVAASPLVFVTLNSSLKHKTAVFLLVLLISRPFQL